MSLAPAARCTFLILALSTLPHQFHCQGFGNESRDSQLAESQMRIFSVTLLGLFVLVLLGFAGELRSLSLPRSTRRAEISDFLCLWPGCICCFCRISRAVESTSDGLDVYAPRTQSIVWPTMPQEAARVLEMTFLHAPKVNCQCRNCCIARNSFCIENCGVNKARWILLLATSVSCAHLAKADDNFTDLDWLNVTQLLQMADFQYENNTSANSTELDLATLADTSTVAPTDADTRTSVKHEPPFEDLRQHRHFGRFVFMVLLLHISVVGVGITIYSCVHCRWRNLRKRSRMEAQRRLQLTNLRSEHIPNSRDCPCHGCILAREMLQGLIMHQLHELVDC
ncbi:LOW QUALITY PROTEIN: uncharacterized protein LOC120446849 [Drosophila santomea]|uniref:LOW QUALITY PROTEIN: uncharacterized protein LOC120446849 n=1 Tax=Drosophila santomea TaxID=129105 RepID=UPI001952FADC|nr:LOW QUALITY PROTEIN: uncharacterized protein LOC120446849 [Drosophila santomea]